MRFYKTVVRGTVMYFFLSVPQTKAGWIIYHESERQETVKYFQGIADTDLEVRGYANTRTTKKHRGLNERGPWLKNNLPFLLWVGTK